MYPGNTFILINKSHFIKVLSGRLQLPNKNGCNPNGIQIEGVQSIKKAGSIEREIPPLIKQIVSVELPGSIVPSAVH